MFNKEALLVLSMHIDSFVDHIRRGMRPAEYINANEDVKDCTGVADGLNQVAIWLRVEPGLSSNRIMGRLMGQRTDFSRDLRLKEAQEFANKARISQAKASTPRTYRIRETKPKCRF